MCSVKYFKTINQIFKKTIMFNIQLNYYIFLK